MYEIEKKKKVIMDYGFSELKKIKEKKGKKKKKKKRKNKIK